MQHSYKTDIHTQQTLITTNIGRSKYWLQQTQHSYTANIDRNTLNIYTQRTFIRIEH